MEEDAIPYPMLISVTQEFETTDLDIVYKVTDTDDANVTTGLLAYIDGDDSFENVIIPKSFLGDVTGKIGKCRCKCDAHNQLGYATGLERIGGHGGGGSLCQG